MNTKENKNIDSQQKLNQKIECFFDKEESMYLEHGINYEEVNSKLMEQSKRILSNLDENYLKQPSQDSKIPLISHQIYLTDINNPKSAEPAPLRLTHDSIIELNSAIKKLNDINNRSDQWIHYIWTNHASIIPENLSTLENVEVKLIDQFHNHILWPHLQNAIEEKFFAQASDILRYIVLEQKGGLYRDMDNMIFKNRGDHIIKLMHVANLLVGKETEDKFAYYGNSLIAATPNHPSIKQVIQSTINNLGKNNPEDIPQYVKYACTKHFKIVYETGPVALTMAVMKTANQEGYVDLVMPRLVFYNTGHIRQITPESRCFSPSQPVAIEGTSEGIKITSNSGDLFCGSWYHANNATSIIDNGENVSSLGFREYNLFQAALTGNLREIQSNSINGENIDTLRKYDITPLFVSVANKHVQAVELLLKKGANPNFIAKDGSTPLLVAIQNNSPSIVSLLLKAGANPNIVNNKGITPLIVAIIIGNKDIISMLREKGADTNVKFQGLELEQLALKLEKPEIIEWLKRPAIQCHFGRTKEMFLQESIDFDALHKKTSLQSIEVLKSIENLPFPEATIIPLITHHIYFSNDNTSFNLDKISTQTTIESLNLLNNSNLKWKHYFWTNTPQHIPEEIKNIENLEVKSIEEFKENDLWEVLQDVLVQAQNDRGLLAQTSDILRYMALFTYGGIYLDLDYRIYNSENLLKLMSISNLLVGKEEYNDFSIGNSFIAVSPKHEVIKEIQKITLRNFGKSDEKIPEYVKYTCLKADQILYQTGPMALTMAFYKAGNQNKNIDLLMPREIFYNREYLRANSPESKCYRPNLNASLDIQYGELKTKTIGADPFCSSWNSEYLLNVLEHGDHVSSTNFRTARIFQSVMSNNLVALEYDLNHVDSPDVINNLGITPLFIATFKGDREAVSILLKAGANPNFVAPNKVSIKQIAQEKELEEILIMLNEAENNLSTSITTNKNTTECFFDLTETTFEQEGIDVKKIDQRFFKDSLAILKKIEDFPTDKKRIPLITHQVYLTSPESPKTMDEVLARITKESITSLNEVDNNWIHFIWTNSFDAIPNELKLLPKIKLMLIEELKDQPFWSEINNRLNNTNNDVTVLVKTSNLIRYSALRKFGGIYRDLDYKIYNPTNLIKLIGQADMLVGKETQNEFSIGNAFIAAIPGHPTIDYLTSLIKRNYNKTEIENIPEYVKYPCTPSNSAENSPVTFTMSVFKSANQKGYVDLVMPKPVLFNYEYVRSTNPDLKCYNPNLKANLINYIHRIKIDTIGGDPLCGSWRSTQQQIINYGKNATSFKYRESRLPVFAATGNTKMINYHIIDGVNVDTTTTYQVTPLFLATIKANVDTVESLLKHGANPNFVAPNGLSIMDAAKQTGNQKIIELIQQAQAKQKMPTKHKNTTECYFGKTKAMFEQEGLDYDELDKKSIQQGLEALARIDEYEFGETKIPLISHQIYLTSKTENKPIDDISLNITKNSIDQLNSSGKWTHYIWTNSVDYIPDSIKNLDNVIVKNLEEFIGDSLWPELSSTLLQAETEPGMYAPASDILLYMVLEKFGGVYRDLDYQIYNAINLIKLMTIADTIVGKETNEEISFIGNAFIACSKASPVCKTAKNLVKRNLDQNNSISLPEYIKYPCVKLDQIMYQLGPSVITMAFYKSANTADSLDLMLPKEALFNADYLHLNTPASRCHNPNITASLNNTINGNLVETIGANMFCGSWALGNGYYTKIIDYGNQITSFNFREKKIFEATELNNIEIMDYYYLEGVNLDNVLYSNNNVTALYKAVERGNLEAAKFLLDKGANPNFKDEDGLSIINLATKNGSAEMIELFKLPEAKFYVVNLDRAKERLRKISNELTKADIKFERFPAIEGKNILITDVENNRTFLGKDLAKYQREQRFNIYNITCNPLSSNPYSFKFIDNNYRVSGELGLWCSNLLIWQDAEKNNYQNIVIFEDDAKPQTSNFKMEFTQFLKILPKNYDVAFLDFAPIKGKLTPLPNNPLVLEPSEGFLAWGTSAVMLSNKGIKKLLSFQNFSKPIDVFYWEKFKNNNLNNTNTDNFLTIYSYVNHNLMTVDANESFIEGHQFSIDVHKKYKTDYFGNPNKEINLFEAAVRGNLELLKSLLKEGIKVDTTTKLGITPLVGSIFGNNEEIVKFLLDNGANPNFKTKEGLTPLQVAIDQRKTKIVKYLLEFGADINTKINNISLIQFAKSRQYEEIIPFINRAYHKTLIAGILENNINLVESITNEIGVNVKLDNIDKTPLYAACEANRLNIVHMLIKKGADVNLTNPLYISASKGNTAITSLLIELGANVNQYLGFETPIHAAVSNAKKEDIQLLLAHGAEIIADTLQTPLYLSAFLKDKSETHAEIYQIMINYYWSLLAQKRDSLIPSVIDKPLEVVVVRFNEDLGWIEKEFSQHPNITITIYNKGEDDLDYLPLYYNVVKTPNVGWFGGTVLLHIHDNYDNLASNTLFVQGNPYEQGIFLPMVRYLGDLNSICTNIIAKCEPRNLIGESKKLENYSPQQWAASKYYMFKPLNYTMVDFFHKYIDPSFPLEDTFMVDIGAQFAVKKDKIQIHSKEYYASLLPLFNETYATADFCLEKALDPLFGPEVFNQTLNHIDSLRLIPSSLDKLLVENIINKNNPAVKNLLISGANPNRNINPDIPLIHFAALHGNAYAIDLLAQYGADLNYINKSGYSPLMISVVKGDLQSTKALIANGANLNFNINGFSLIDIATKEKHFDIVDLLRSFNNYDMTYIISYENDASRKQKLSLQLSRNKVKFKTLKPLDTRKIQFMNIQTQAIFPAHELKNKASKSNSNDLHNVFCNSNEAHSVSYIYTGKLMEKLGKYATICNNLITWNDALRNGYKNIIILSDNILLNSNNINLQFNDFISHLPSSYDIGFIDYIPRKGSEELLPDNNFVSIPGKNFLAFGTHAVVYSKSGVEKLVKLPFYNQPLDKTIWNFAHNNILNNTKFPISLEVYKYNNDKLVELNKGYSYEHNIDINFNLKELPLESDNNLFNAVRNGNFEQVKYLIALGYNPHILTKDGSNLLHLAAESGNVLLFDYLLKEGLDPTVKNIYGADPLAVATIHDNNEILKLLVDLKARSELSFKNQTLDMIALSHNNLIGKSILDTLNYKPVNQNYVNILLIHVCEKGIKSLVEYYLSLGADVNFNIVISPLVAATVNNHVEVVKLLLEKGADPNLNYPLYYSAMHGNHQITKLLLDSNANPNLRRPDGDIALRQAVNNGNYLDTKYLVEAGAEIQSDQMHTPLFEASYYKDRNKDGTAIYNLLMNKYWPWLEEQLKIISPVKTIKSFEVAIARYKEDLNWIYKEFDLNTNITIYNKGPNDLYHLKENCSYYDSNFDDKTNTTTFSLRESYTNNTNCKIISVPNVGWFGGTILFHMYAKYDELADRTLFLQGFPYDQELFLPIVRYKGELNSTCKNFIAKCINSTLIHQSDIIKNTPAEIWAKSRYPNFVPPKITMVDYFHKIISPDFAVDKPLYINLGAQAAIDKENIQYHSKEFYFQLFSSDFNETYATADFFLEKSWDAFFQDPKINYYNNNKFYSATEDYYV